MIAMNRPVTIARTPIQSRRRRLRRRIGRWRGQRGWPAGAPAVRAPAPDGAPGPRQAARAAAHRRRACFGGRSACAARRSSPGRRRAVAARVSTVTVTDRPGRSSRGQRLVGRQGDAHRHALHDLGEIAGGVVGRQQAELGAAGRREALDAAGQRPVGIGVDRDLGRLARPHPGQLRLLEIGRDIDMRQRHQRQQLRPGLDVLPGPAGAVAGDAGDRRPDHRVVEVVLGQLQAGAGLLPLGLLPRRAAPAARRAGSARAASAARALRDARPPALRVLGLGRLEALPAGEIARDQLRCSAGNRARRGSVRLRPTATSAVACSIIERCSSSRLS